MAEQPGMGGMTRTGIVVATAEADERIDGILDTVSTPVKLNQFFWLTVGGKSLAKTEGAQVGDTLVTSAAGNLVPMAGPTVHNTSGKTVTALTATNEPILGYSYVLISDY